MSACTKHCVAPHDASCGIAFHLAKRAGVTVAHQVAGCKVAATPHTQARVREEENLETEECVIEELQAGSEPNAPLPYFPEYAWPEPLATILSHARTRAQCDALLLGAFTVLGASLGQRVCCNYGGRILHPCLQTFVVAPPASGKGMLGLLRYLVAPIHDELRQAYHQRQKDYQREKVTYDTLRKAFDHDRLSYNRRMDQEYREVSKSYLGVLLSGTPAQVRPLIPSAENGLFSRQLCQRPRDELLRGSSGHQRAAHDDGGGHVAQAVDARRRHASRKGLVERGTEKGMYHSRAHVCM